MNTCIYSRGRHCCHPTTPGRPCPGGINPNCLYYLKPTRK